MTDEQELGALVESAYAALAFKPGEQPDWAQFNAVFHPAAVLALRIFPQDREVSVLDLTAYAEAQMRNGLREEGYSETPGSRSIEITGDVALIRQEFTMNFAHRPAVEALDVFSCARVGRGWSIISVLSDMQPESRPRRP
ncbi:hypothetical protein OHA27_02675 [Streptomyces sp. NBC_01619]|uniref:Uncharacterized protein n=1 Tax=Streptomyces pratisoli TaxID=3139917 RepID=A0ACC6QFN7_9ACTN|nr:hypothetical protein [Streptomyces sp. NBC_01619]MCX4509221.1 hypothetical protein [Streptomyces sp. NBC_01619]